MTVHLYILHYKTHLKGTVYSNTGILLCI